MLKTIREALILTEGGAAVKTYSSAGQALLLLGLVPAFGVLASRVKRVMLLRAVTVFFIANVILFFLAGVSGLHVGVPFFIWVGIFNPARGQVQGQAGGRCVLHARGRRALRGPRVHGRAARLRPPHLRGGERRAGGRLGPDPLAPGPGEPAEDGASGCAGGPAGPSAERRPAAPPRPRAPPPWPRNRNPEGGRSSGRRSCPHPARSSRGRGCPATSARSWSSRSGASIP